MKEIVNPENLANHYALISIRGHYFVVFIVRETAKNVITSGSLSYPKKSILFVDLKEEIVQEKAQVFRDLNSELHLLNQREVDYRVNVRNYKFVG